MLDRDRQRFINENYHNLAVLELQYRPRSSPNILKDKKKYCAQLVREYHGNCDDANFASKLRDFYDDGFYNQYKTSINQINNLHDLKTLYEKVQLFKILFKVAKDDIANPQIMLAIQKQLKSCVENRITYKYDCLLPAQRDKGHDAEILRYIFYHQRMDEIVQLIRQIRQRYHDLKAIVKQRHKQQEERYRQQEERYQQELKQRKEELEIINEIDNEEDPSGSSDSDEEAFTPVVSKKKKKTSRKHTTWKFFKK